MTQPIKTTLISVSDKTGIVDLANKLTAQGIQIISTGGTAALLKQHNIPVTAVSDYTGFPEIMDGRVKTLHPKIHAALLARPTIDDATLAEHNISPIDLVIVNLYPFSQATASPTCDLATALEYIDIGGPTMLRAAAKNHPRVTVIVDPEDYPRVLNELEQHNNSTTLDTRLALAQKVFTHTAHYDAAVASYLAQTSTNKTSTRKSRLPASCQPLFIKQQNLRYGENPHQQAALYTDTAPQAGTIATATQVQGKALSFNNLVDADAALSCVRQFTQSACVIVKHANPCGVATGQVQHTVYQRAFQTDATSAFGGILAFNQTLTAATATAIINQQFSEVILAPDIEEAAKQVLRGKPHIRVLCIGQHTPQPPSSALIYKRISGGLLIQEPDNAELDSHTLQTHTQRAPSAQEHKDLLFAWKIAKSVKSNAIVLAKAGATIGIGAGQMSRIDSTKIATRKAAEAKLSTQSAVLASDAFFPFPDNITLAAEMGITAIIQPGGSIRDEAVIKAADDLGIAMLFTGIRHFYH